MSALVNVPCPTCGRSRMVYNGPGTITRRQTQECRDCGIRTRSISRRRTYREREGAFDDVVVERLCAGRDVPYATTRERQAAMLTMLTRGVPGEEIAARSGLSPRTVDRWRAKRVAA